MKVKPSPIFDVEKAKATIEKNRRGSWWQRIGTQRSFQYLDRNGKVIKNKPDLDRIKSLVIPPAWRFVRINPSSGGKIQVVGMDAIGRVQYRYHPVFSAKQQRSKFAKVEPFGRLLPKLRQATNAHLRLKGLPRDRVLAVVMQLINSLYFRVGTDLSEKHYKTYGITTLQKRHLTIGKKGKLSFEFTGKSHVAHRKIIVDEKLASIVRDLASLGRGRKLFRYLDDDGKPHPVTPAQINAYIKAATGAEYSSKDFRTWGATVLAAIELAEAGIADGEAERKKNIVRAVKRVAEELGNTPAVCRSSYIHPAVLDAYAGGVTIEKPNSTKQKTRGLGPEEKALLKLLKSARK